MPTPKDNDLDGDGTVTVRERFAFLGRVWRATPRPARRAIVAIIGGTLVVLGIVLVVLPGPFTLPLLIAGFAVLGTEFAWAAHVLHKGRTHVSRATSAIRKRVPKRRAAG